MARELRGRRAGMDTLVSLSVLVAFFASAVQTVRHGQHVWYDAAVMFVFLLLCARMLEQRVRRLRHRAGRCAGALAVLETEGGAMQVPVAQLQPGDTIRVAHGETVPADAVLLEAEGAFDEACSAGNPRRCIASPATRYTLPAACATAALGAAARHRHRHRHAPVRTRALAEQAQTRLLCASPASATASPRRSCPR